MLPALKRSLLYVAHVCSVSLSEFRSLCDRCPDGQSYYVGDEVSAPVGTRDSAPK